MSGVTHITVRVPLRIRQRAGRKTVVTPVLPGGAPGVPTRADPALVKALARAHRWSRMLEEGRYVSLSEMAAAEKVDRSFLGKLLGLTLLAPDVVEAVLEGRASPTLNLAALIKPMPDEWTEQRRQLV